MGIQFAEQFGGSGMSAVDYCICIEELARVCPAIALSVAAHNGLCSSHIAMFGNEAQKAKYLPRLVRGEVLGAWGLTEAGAGSDAAGMKTSAVRDGAAGGSTAPKNFITHGRIGGVMVVVPVTDRAKGNRGISAFVVEHGTPGMSAGQEGEQARHARKRHERGDFPGLPVPGRRTCSAKRGRASSTRCRCSTPGESALPRCRSGSRRGRTKRPGTMRRNAGSSVSRSRRSRQSSGSSPTTPPGSRRRGC